MSTHYKALIFMAVLVAIPASANSIIALELFNYTGTCADCAFSTGTLELIAGYTPGTPVTSSNFFDFTYTSNLLNFAINQNDPGFSVSGDLPATLPGPATLVIEDNAWEFSSSATGSWFVSNLSTDDFGPANSWSAVSGSVVPEPSAIAMLGLGLAAMVRMKARSTHLLDYLLRP